VKTEVTQKFFKLEVGFYI